VHDIPQLRTESPPFLVANIRSQNNVSTFELLLYLVRKNVSVLHGSGREQQLCLCQTAIDLFGSFGYCIYFLLGLASRNASFVRRTRCFTGFVNCGCRITEGGLCFAVRFPRFFVEGTYDSSFVRTRHISSSDNAAMSSSVERFARRSFRSCTPPVNQFVNSEAYSPTQAMVTKPAHTYSAISQRDRDFDRDTTSDGVRVIIGPQAKAKRTPNVFR
jgi:hypothetical protein